MGEDSGSLRARILRLERLRSQPPLQVVPRHRISGPHGLRLCAACGEEVIEGEQSRLVRGKYCAACARTDDEPPPRAA